MLTLVSLIRTALLAVIVAMTGPAITAEDEPPSKVLFTNVYIFDGVG